MKLVREHIEQFTRGENPFKTLKIGKRVEIENWFKTWAPDANYKIDEDLNIKIKGNLWFQRSSITSLPDNLHVEGHLDIRNTNITSLPDSLYIRGWLDLEETKIISLPNDLHVMGNLYMKKINVTSLPDDLIVGGEIFKDF